MTMKEFAVQIKATLESVRQKCVKAGLNTAVQEIDQALVKVNLFMGGL